MTEFIIQNLWLVLAFVAVLSLTAGMMLMGSKYVRRCQDCKLLRGCADRETARMAEQDWAEQTGVEPKCPCGAWEVCEGCDLVVKQRQSRA